MATLDSNLRVRIEPEYRDRLKVLAKKRGLNESKLIRALVMEAVDADIPSDAPIDLPAMDADLFRHPTKVYLPNYILLASKLRAREAGLSYSRWLGALLQSHLTEVPVMLKPELMALEAGDRQLRSLGINLNQIARAMHTVPKGSEGVTPELLNALWEEIEELRNAINVLIRLSRNKWKVAIS